MDSFDLNTRLPPRKRLLAGLKMVSSSCDFELPIPLASSDLGARLRDVINSATSSPEEIIEVTKSVALAAAEIAAAARNTAMEKAAIAAKAWAAARRALDFLCSSSSRTAAQTGRPRKPKLRKKHVPIKLLYKANRALESQETNKELVKPSGSSETDEELARRLHRAMNSSPRISNNKRKRLPTYEKEGIPGGHPGMAPAICGEVVQLPNGCSTDRSEEKNVVCSKADILEEEDSCYFTGKRRYVSESGGIAGGKMPKLKRKKLLLSECNSRETDEAKEGTYSVDNLVPGGSELNKAERSMYVNDVKPSNDCSAKMKITSMWKCKKFKASHCSSDRKIMHAIHSTPSPSKTSAMVKVD
ncbi:uncharacterized protein [Typha angustifolia]|uniref:uncharacterized protein n=1 Tax=Typha angustifolia TaxID=59011 RepID=UPI003C2B9C63